MPRIGHLELFSANPIASRDFYCDVLGFELVEVQGGQCVWLKLGAIEILLRPGAPSAAPDRYREARCAIVIYTDDLAQTAREWEGRGLTFRGTDGSDACLTFTDPDGHWFQLVNPADH